MIGCGWVKYIHAFLGIYIKISYIRCKCEKNVEKICVMCYNKMHIGEIVFFCEFSEVYE